MSDEIKNPLPEQVQKPNTVAVPAEAVTTLNIDNIPNNSILIINVDVSSPEEKMALAPVFARLLSPFANILREKKVSVMLMRLNENINLVSEADMNAAGWFKKEKSLIINPYDKH